MMMEVAANSVIGKQRTSNEDYIGYFYNSQNAMIAILADGVGGSNGGDIAASMAVDYIGNQFENYKIKSISETKEWLSDVIKNINSQIIEIGLHDETLSNMATTIVVALFFGNQFMLTHLGDSRCYLLRNEKLQQLTIDHSYVNFLVEKGELNPEEAASSEMKNVIVKGLGVSSNAEVDISTIQIKPNDELLICSDGLTKMIDNDEIQSILQKRISTKQKLDTLIDNANDNGGLDNISAIVINNLLGSDHL